MPGANKRDVIGRFQLGEIIGSGGFGTVHRALDPDGNKVAIKLLAPHMDSDETLERFHREGTIRIEHPNVVRVLDAGLDKGVSFIAFELLEGDPLSTVLENAPLPLAQVLDAAAQISAGLTAAHERAIVHRDPKPANIFCCEDGVIKILDFGIARPMSQAGPQLTMAGAVIGTPGYLSPEQAKGDPNISPAADIWSLGVILYQALSGKNPFLRQSAVATILAVVLEEPPAIETAAELPAGLVDAISRCLDKDPSRRWESAEQLAAALAAIDLDAVPTPAPIEPTAIAEDERRVVALLLATEVRDLATLEAAVDEHGGRLTPMLGGAIGVFGGQTYEGDEAQRAVSAALSARGAATLMAVSTGRATGTRGTVSGEAVGAVERAIEARLSGVAVGASAARMLRGHFELRPVPDRKDVFEVPRALTRRETGELLAVQPDRPLLGRSTELAQLDDVVGRALESSRASVIWVSGPAGIGKSRLRLELERRLRARENLTLLTACGESHRREVAFHAMASLLRSAPMLEPFFLNPGVSEPRRERALHTFLADVFNDNAWAVQCFRPLAKLLGLSLDTKPTDRAADAQLLADQMRIAISDLLCEMARTPLAIILDDGQWVDAQTLSLLDRQLRRLSDRPLLIFVAARPELAEQRPALFEGPRLRRIEPAGLVLDDVDLLARICAGREVPRPVVEAIATRTGGNPFFVEQILRELIEQDLLDHEPESLPIPLDVEGAVQSRLDHLPRGEKLICKRAAVFTRPFTAPALEALDVAESQLHLQQLERRGLVAVPRTLSREEEYRFESSLVAEVAYGMNTDEARVELHRLAAAFLLHRADVDHEELARHHDLGGEPELAARAYAEAARTASSRGDSGSVLRCSERALELGLDGDAAVELHLACADALSFLGDRKRQRASLDR
ncbi:MAG TPA: hypothetical protein ENK57_07215, partial [Polyangiaceae bacterium]|nr:hypothetical protein [Polyangiaceae bacterium]